MSRPFFALFACTKSRRRRSKNSPSHPAINMPFSLSEVSGGESLKGWAGTQVPALFFCLRCGVSQKQRANVSARSSPCPADAEWKKVRAFGSRGDAEARRKSAGPAGPLFHRRRVMVQNKKKKAALRLAQHLRASASPCEPKSSAISARIPSSGERIHSPSRPARQRCLIISLVIRLPSWLQPGSRQM